MKIWVQDNGVYGMIICIAHDEEEARKKMKNERNYDRLYPVESYEINEDFIYSNSGDM